MLENGSLWASFVKIGALYSRHQKRSLWHRFLCPHYRGALDRIGPKSVPIGPLDKIFKFCIFMQQVLDIFWIFFQFGLEKRDFLKKLHYKRLQKYKICLSYSYICQLRLLVSNFAIFHFVLVSQECMAINRVAIINALQGGHLKHGYQ